jgi:D-alanyl-D-alanine carboxypeptidase
LNIEKELKRIHSSNRWASEQTLERILRLVGVNSSQTKKAVDSLQGNSDDIKKLLTIIKGEDSNLSKFTSNVKSLNDILKGSFYERDLNPITASANAIEMAAGLFADRRSDASELTDEVKSFLGKAVGLGSNVAGLTASTAGIIAVYGQVFSEQEKVLRAGIDMGASLRLDEYTDMNLKFAAIGKSINEIFTEYKTNMPMLANLPGSSLTNLGKFAELTTIIKNDDGLPDFGYNAGQLMRRLVDEADILRQYNSLSDLNIYTEKLVTDRFIKSSIAATVMADILGADRDSILAARTDAAKDIDFTSAITRRQSEVLDMFGEGAKENIIDFQTNINVLLSRLLNENFASETTSLITRAVNDGNWNNIMANMSQDMNILLNYLGDRAKGEFISILQEGIKGRMTTGDTVMAVQGFLSSLAASEPYKISDITDPIVDEAIRLQSLAILAPESFMDMSRRTYETNSRNTAMFAETADGSVDAMDSLRRAFLQVSRLLTPGFGTSAQILYGFGKTLDWTTDVVGEVLGSFVNWSPIIDDEGSQTIPIAPPRPPWWQTNGLLPSSPRHPQRIWDRQYGEYFNTDGSLREGADVTGAARAVSSGPTGAMTADLTGVAADPDAGGTLQNGRLPAGELQAITGGGRLRVGAAEAFNRMVEAAAADGVTIVASSTYRSLERQQELWNSSTRPLSERSKWVATPGGSNHGWGLAFDEGTIYRQHESAPQYQWLRQHGLEYGFYQRMAHESWHWEYTGAPGTSDVTTANPGDRTTTTSLRATEVWDIIKEARDALPPGPERVRLSNLMNEINKSTTTPEEAERILERANINQTAQPNNNVPTAISTPEETTTGNNTNGSDDILTQEIIDHEDESSSFISSVWNNIKNLFNDEDMTERTTQ